MNNSNKYTWLKENKKLLIKNIFEKAAKKNMLFA